MAEARDVVRKALEAASPAMEAGAEAFGVVQGYAKAIAGKARDGLTAVTESSRVTKRARGTSRKEQEEAAGYASQAAYDAHAPYAIMVPDEDVHATALDLAQAMCAAALAPFPRMRDMVESSNPWATKYRRAMAALTRQDHPGEGTACAKLGLEFVGESFQLGNGTLLKDVTLDDTDIDLDALRAAVLEIDGGAAKPKAFSLLLDEEDLSGSELVDYMVAMHVEQRCQAGAVEAMEDLVSHPEWLENIEESVFVLLGAGSSVSPARQLLAWGAHVVAIDTIEVLGMTKLMDAAVRCAGKLTVAPPDCRDVMANPVGIAKWLTSSFDERIVLVDTVNRFGADWLYTAAANDLIGRLVCTARPDTALAWCGVPFDAYMLPEDAPMRRHIGASPVSSAIDFYARLRRLPQARVGGVFNGLTDYRGAILAAVKRIERWRATVEREAGRVISYSVMPYTTLAETMNRTARMLDVGFRYFGYTSSHSENTGAFAAAMLMWDLNNPDKIREDDFFMVSRAVDGAVFSVPYEPGTLTLPMRIVGM